MALHPEYKIILLGDPGVGKTTFFLRIKEGDFVDTELRPTASLGVEHLEHQHKIGGVDVKVMFSDVWIMSSLSVEVRVKHSAPVQSLLVLIAV